LGKSYGEMVAGAKAETEQTDVGSVHETLASGEDVTVLDVREPVEWEEGYIPGATHVPRGMLELRSSAALPDKDARIVVHCALGGRGSLGEMGYTNVANMEGGLSAWSEAGYDVE
jgi:rhodanese-related sulfurtransferase